ncbi:MarR family winged helix-turn-helix transcriptional regulator [Nocardia blacklockiae]|uniref:MarR family winged helix-turn-helix transcriptional regulator n=1 Tax=Nocardia blacklockiae TaxID=480036 RepID=UPI0018952F99|nr:MarR family transcriptional regulator [Nocardia blacklockiae]MBF6172789.1 MarR family transcriptional regulator [Nocardia blacklockiae]
MSDPRWLDELEQRAWLAFRTAVGSLDRRLDQQLERDAGLSHVQYEILVRLAEAPDRELRMRELATALLDSKSKLTYQIDRLERAGLVRRRQCPSDMRAVYAVLTEAGQRALEQAAPGHVAAVRALFLDALTPEQLAALAAGLGEVNRRLAAED